MESPEMNLQDEHQLIFSMKVPRQLNRRVFSINGAGTTAFPHAKKNEIGPPPHIIWKINKKWIIDKNESYNYKKTLGKKNTVYFSDLG